MIILYSITLSRDGTTSASDEPCPRDLPLPYRCTALSFVRVTASQQSKIHYHTVADNNNFLQDQLKSVIKRSKEALVSITMDKQPSAVFRNVGQLYFPQTRVECHYSLTRDHRWSSSDWIGIFEVGWSSVKQYYTYTWALVPEGHTEGTDVNCCVIFHASYLPRPTAVEYEFVYVGKIGEVCARSRPFTFCAPMPLDELETLTEERDEDDEEEELLLVIPRAQLLQCRLEECLKNQVELQKALDTTREEMEQEKENTKKAKTEWELERGAMKEEISELGDTMRQYYQTLRKIEGKHKDVKYDQENLTSELSKLMAEKVEGQQRIRNLEEHNEHLNDREKEGTVELERLKERVKKMSCQLRHDEEKRKSLQVENEAALVEVQRLQERSEAREHLAKRMRRELRELGIRQGHIHTELHQARLQVAQLNLQLSEENLALREERASWALERETCKRAADADKKKFQELSGETQRMEAWLQEERMEREKLEVELESERDCKRVLLDELQDLEASQRKARRERDEQQAEKQDLVNYIHQLEQRLEVVPETRSHEEIMSLGSSSEDDDGPSSASPGSLCSLLSLSTHLERPDGADVSLEKHGQSQEDTPAPDTHIQHCKNGAFEGKRVLILPEIADPVLSELAESSW